MSKVNVVRLYKLKYFAQQKRKTRSFENDRVLESIAIEVTVFIVSRVGHGLFCAIFVNSYITFKRQFRSLDLEIE